jgi:hypothetical protein
LPAYFLTGRLPILKGVESKPNPPLKIKALRDKTIKIYFFYRQRGRANVRYKK